MYLAKVYVTLKESILDPQGVAVKNSLGNLDIANIDDVRIGKYITLKINEPDKARAENQVKTMCEKLLCNTVIENYSFELGEA